MNRKNALLLGTGYWGSIILKNLTSMKIYENIIICDARNDINNDYTKIPLETFSDVFICTPTATHYELCEYFLKNKKSVFCEKPLVLNMEEAEKIYKTADQHKSILFVDWIYTFNSGVNKIKNIIENNILGKLHSVTLNRNNENQLRTNDITCKWDLASHDVTILYYLLTDLQQDICVEWLDYKRVKDNDSIFGLARVNDVSIVISDSWTYGVKERDCIFKFENGIIIWDDNTLTVKVYSPKEEIFSYASEKSSLQNSINSFLERKDDILQNNRLITLKTLKTLIGEKQ